LFVGTPTEDGDLAGDTSCRLVAGATSCVDDLGQGRCPGIQQWRQVGSERTRDLADLLPEIAMDGNRHAVVGVFGIVHLEVPRADPASGDDGPRCALTIIGWIGTLDSDPGDAAQV
jgi:hypothetical protein